MKKNKKKIILLSLIIFIIICLIVFLKINIKDNNKLVLEENKWIEENKHNVIDIALMNDLPILSYEGEGILYDYLNYVGNNNSLKFNVITYKLNETVEYNYKTNIVDKLSNSDIEIYRDNLILVTYNKIKYSDIKEIQNLKIGVITQDQREISDCLSNNAVTYITYNNYDELKKAIINSKNQETKDDTTLDGVIILKNTILKELIEEDFNIAYHFDDISRFYVLSINNNEVLKSIMNKQFNTWSKTSFDELYNKFLLENYFKFKKIPDVEQKKLKSKNYVFGFINYGIYNYINGNKLSGVNGLILEEFNKFSGVSIIYTQYNSINKLLEEFNSNKIDFVFNLVNDDKYKTQIHKTNYIFDKQLLVVSQNNSGVIIDNINSLKKYTVLTLKDSYLEDYLINNNIKFKSYNNMEDLTNDFENNALIIIDIDNFNYYKTTAFKNSRINYLLDIENKYSFVVNDKTENELFKQLYEFYLSYNSINKLISTNYERIAPQEINFEYVLIIIIIIFGIYIVLDFYNHIKMMFKTIKKSTREKLTKEEKIKYIDQLTSLKNRTYLNSKIESWDESEIYPQSIIIIDLNNISYINDNYGREEGDKVITEAANILIQNQMQNSEIIRTDGNEFLIYLVGYTEKQIISYRRKLSKEFKNLSHGFGIASGYSIITDAIKTVDDAVNEATLAMKENKEEIEH